ncbi:MAG: preprotein translocase subunit SecG [Gammaproteobacteria bacterium]|nr:preprotein translocase subunit SecG [Gammaproteobacteria bacterium]MCY4227352.1 preprotein translocase subunit SecG [Gammaproteobacteria bacterium]
MLSNLLLVFHLLVALTIIVLVLLQQGKGADMGAAFGGGSSETLFGARGSASFLTRITSSLAVIFFVTSLVLAFLFTRQTGDTSVIEQSSVLQSAENVLVETPETVEGSQQEDSDVPQIPE